MGARWLQDPVAAEVWRAPAGLTRAARAMEQDVAAGGRVARLVQVDGRTSAAASVALRMPLPGRRVYAYLRWAVDGRTNERYIGEARGSTRAAYLRDAWRQVARKGLLPATLAEAASPLASRLGATDGRAPGMPRRDVTRARELRSRLHCAGLRFRVDELPFPGFGSRADVVFPRAKVAVVVERKASDAELAADTRPSTAGWECVRVAVDDDLATVVRSVADLVRSRPRSAHDAS